MDSKQTIRVALGERSYPIEIGSGNLPEAGRFLAALGGAEHVVLMTDAIVEPLHAPVIGDSLAVTGAEVDLVVVEAGEPSKSAAVAVLAWHKLLELGADRKTVVVALGGGVIGDLAGFVAATYARGIRLLQIPTTLLAQVDSSVGGKVGINLPGAKNMVGAFWQPLGVLIDTDVLGTLPRREFVSGLAEVIKYGVILDAEFFSYLEAHVAELDARQPAVLRQVIARCCRLKADVVEADERELAGGRAALNYGHTFAHALEAVAGYGELLHGEAVSIGMTCAARLAERLGRIDSAFVRRQESLLAAIGLPVQLPPADHDALVDAMARDKKTEAGRLRFVLPDRLGHVELVAEVAAADVRAALAP
ncbi:MAG TPA: 3-dehydroquinate synthase [Pirellulales bacterium]|jgi:3-dehydroquinate synthase|nr:3-dehydroquinate synthase [Pirellulales bacterium]